MSDEYHKINAPYKRDKKGVMLQGEWCMPELAYLADNEWEFTEKVDGTNIRLTFNRYGGFHIGGRTDSAQIPKPLLAHLENLSESVSKNVVSVMELHDISELTVYGEGYGPKINGGGKYADLPSFVAFDIRVGDFWLMRKDVDDFGDKTGFDTVPVVFTGNLWSGFGMVANGFSRDLAGNFIDMRSKGHAGMKSAWGDFEAEGLIAVPKVPLFTRSGKRVITKIKHVDFRR
jgi:hypothetical protein